MTLPRCASPAGVGTSRVSKSTTVSVSLCKAVDAVLGNSGKAGVLPQPTQAHAQATVLLL